jgi:hypothetical protein
MKCSSSGARFSKALFWGIVYEGVTGKYENIFVIEFSLRSKMAIIFF